MQLQLHAQYFQKLEKNTADLTPLNSAPPLPPSPSIVPKERAEAHQAKVKVLLSTGTPLTSVPPPPPPPSGVGGSISVASGTGTSTSSESVGISSSNAGPSGFSGDVILHTGCASNNDSGSLSLVVDEDKKTQSRMLSMKNV